MDSPRGRLYLIRAVDEERLPANDSFAKYTYRCLDCRACETACPSGVHFGQLIEEARALYEEHNRRPLSVRLLRKFVFEWLFPYPRRINMLFNLLWFYQKSGLRWFARNLGILKLMGSTGKMEALLPELPAPWERKKIRGIISAQGERRYRVGFFTGCVMNTVFTPTNLATIRVLVANGCELVIPGNQNCCGALNIHSGEREAASRMARRNIRAFESLDLDAIVVNAAGCGATLKEYPELLAHDPEYAERAETFSNKVKDISEFLVGIEMSTPEGEIRKRVTYDEPCHLVHAQKIHDPPRQMIHKIPGIDFVELRESEWCCGSAGIYNILQPEISAQILERKIKYIQDTEAEIVLTGNPGCLLQIQMGIRQHQLPIRVMHPIDLLDAAYRKKEI